MAKSGTTYLQRILFDNRALLKQNGVLYPGSHRTAHFMAVLDLRREKFHGHSYPRAEGAWSRTVEAANAFPGTTLFSHERLARCHQEAIERAVSSFDTDDVRVVITARDLARQIPAVWQERLKNRNEESYSSFLDSVFRTPEGRPRYDNFWWPQNLTDLVGRWAKVVGTDRTTLVTVPQTGGDPQELWRRFAQAVELPAADYDLEVRFGNPSLGVVESEMLRRLNPKLRDLPWPDYEAFVKSRLAENHLLSLSHSGRLTVPDEYRDEVASHSERTIGYLEQSGCRIIGDLADLRPAFPAAGGLMPDDVEDNTLLELAMQLVAQYSQMPTARPEVVRTRRWLERLKVRFEVG